MIKTMNQEIVTITEKAIREITKIFTNDSSGKGKSLRLGVIGGGCSGLSYKMDFSEKKENDYQVSFPDFTIVIDPKSAIYLQDVILDYQDGLQGKGFIFDNPNAKNTCGCGESFSF